MTTIDMSKEFAEARARGEVALLCEEIEALRAAIAAVTERAERDEAELTAARALLREALAWVHEGARNFGPPAAKSLCAAIEAHLEGT